MRVDDRADAWDGGIRCQLGGVDRPTATELLLSMVHHHCTRCDAAVELIEALDAVIDDLVGTLWQRWDGIEAIEMGTQRRRLDLRLFGRAPPSGDLPVDLGSMASAFFPNVTAERPGEVVVSCDLSPGSQG